MRATTLDIGHLATLGLSRGVIETVNDQPKCQEVKAKLLYNEENEVIERFQTYGHHSVPVKPSMVDGEMKGFEGVVAFMHGQREHPVMISGSDRRYEPSGNNAWKEGEVGTYHYQGATAKHTSDGYVHDQGPNKKPITFKVGNTTHQMEENQHVITIGSSTLDIEDGTITATVGGSKVIIKDGTVSIVSSKVELGAQGASIPVMLQSGPSSIVFASG